mmetsp:Transcript_20391/g.36993  ORF Transcript_20391/g.36993 Transcript_20391/m.36993 type:complete len:336 (+) Transcript_20391:248-1255(+)|eukprot:CAMPEP_0202480702 /NCGR_PEP_ID=MMETSP1361-20130828/585_1 /ASSEMBLY_ACC=CAM_ASM_000849 /TAXON_ID=210615 /ORGANISM="Staurosira complex sp., Strain CCMP2646" /LENGTH=335 /DNA_ID=CAMNT_0049108155 /DNA_START=183 /DNA_END=1193 /DNA_ORIENTATION=-
MKSLVLFLMLMTSCLLIVHGQDDDSSSLLVLFSIVPRSAGGIRAPHDNHIHVGEPRMIPEPSTGAFICLIQQETGNFRILRSLSPVDCNMNVGTLIYQSGVHIPIPQGQQYYTRMQWNGNLYTRTYAGDNENDSTGVWKTVSPENYDHKPFYLVLNQDDRLDIQDENSTSIWNSWNGESCITTDTWGESCGLHRPLALLRTIPRDQRTVGPNSSPVVYRDDLTESYVCVIQEWLGNFRVLRGNDCQNNTGDVLYESGFHGDFDTNDVYVTHLQRDGNLITRHTVTRDTAWTTCSYQGYIQEMELVLTSSDSLAIVGADGTVAWESTRDDSCHRQQ